MNDSLDLAHELDRAIPHPAPGASPAAYLVLGRRSRRRRLAGATVAGVAVLAVGGGAALGFLDLPPGTTGGTPAATPHPEPDPIPAWAQEHGNHGPVSIAPDGDLWVAPDARLVRSVEVPASSFPDLDVVSAYAVEAETDGETWWSFVFRTSHSAEDRAAGLMEPADEWTTDFDVWVDYVTADLQGRQRFSERLVRFAGGSSDRLVARPGAEVVDQTSDVAVPGWESHPRSSVAEVRYDGRTWFVVAQGPRSGRPFYSPFQAEAVGSSDIEEFLDQLGDDVSGTATP
jgi:hypothetical protein